MEKRKIYTEEEDNLIIKTIGNNPDNIAQRCRELSKILNRKPINIRYRWYKLTKKGAYKLEEKPRFALLGKTTIIPNRKINKSNTQQPITLEKSKFRRILDILFE